MVVLNFIWYCIQCMISCICISVGGYVPEDFGFNDILAGIITIIVICLIIFFILWATGIISFNKQIIKKDKL